MKKKKEKKLLNIIVKINILKVIFFFYIENYLMI